MLEKCREDVEEILKYHDAITIAHDKEFIDTDEWELHLDNILDQILEAVKPAIEEAGANGYTEGYSKGYTRGRSDSKPLIEDAGKEERERALEAGKMLGREAVAEEYKEELRIGNILTAKLTDKCRELESTLSSQAEKIKREFREAMYQEIDFHGKDSALGVAFTQVMSHILMHKDFIDKWHCATCNRNFQGGLGRASHYRGKKHKENAEKLKEKIAKLESAPTSKGVGE